MPSGASLGLVLHACPIAIFCQIHLLLATGQVVMLYAAMRMNQVYLCIEGLKGWVDLHPGWLFAGMLLLCVDCRNIMRGVYIHPPCQFHVRGGVSNRHTIYTTTLRQKLNNGNIGILRKLHWIFILRGISWIILRRFS